MPSSIKTIVGGFPFPTIDLIIITPKYEIIADIHIKINPNAASVQSNIGCGTLGLLFLTVSPAVYATLSTIVFVPPINPEPKPNIPTGSTCASIADLRYHHAEAIKIFTEYKNTNKSFIGFCWRLQTNCMSDPYAINTSATVRPLLEPYWIISTLNTLTFPPPRCIKITSNPELPTTAISRWKP